MASERGALGTISLEQISTDSSPLRVSQARELLLEYGRFVIAQPGAARFCFGTLEKEAADLPESYRASNGGCLMALTGTDPQGFVAWKALPDSVAPSAWEMKRLWVRPAARGLGLGRTLTVAVLDRARDAGRSAVYLDTVPRSMSFAYRLYLDLGFEPCAPYNDNPIEGIAYLRLKI